MSISNKTCNGSLADDLTGTVAGTSSRAEDALVVAGRHMGDSESAGVGIGCARRYAAVRRVG